MKITMKDIAKQANVSIATVSLVLNHKPGRVSDEMREKILRLAKEMNYVPNQMAKQLVTQKSNAIGIIVPDLENYFFASLVSRLQNEMRKRNIFVLIVTSGDEIEEDIKGIDLLISRGVDLLILTVSNHAHNNTQRYLQKLQHLPVPAIMVDRIIEEYQGPKIQFNDFDGMIKLTNYVISQNHKKIAFINGDRKMARTAGRTQGFLSAMKDANLNVSQDDIYDGNYSYESGYDFFDEIYDQNRYTSIIAANDMMAYGLMKRAFERELHIPEDISICGYDNVKFSEMLNPTLTTVNQNLDDLIKEILILIEKLLKDRHYTESIVLDTELMVRNSVKKI
ncbi:MAG: LacI family transcriptional regulator [Erysipelothrix sp.]|nr:LacI family transcriptional regulator [Erysipelothrix sp.]